MNRKANIEFLSKSSVIITNAYRQKAFDLSDMFFKHGQGYIDLVELKFVSADDLDKVDRELRFIAGLKSTGLSILAKPKPDGEWMLMGHAQMGCFQYWYAGQRQDESPDETTNKNEGTFKIKIV